ncbi:MAG: flippase-like domain-containing protein [Epulopiscium sp.]|nr:flippase-like domain-containing protein [Candidatus Epulonipiscium sp.]
MDKNSDVTNNEKQDKKKHFIYIIILFILMGITFFILLKDQDLYNLFRTIGKLNVIMVACGLVSAFLFICSEALNFKIMLTLVGEKSSFLQTLKYSFVGFYFSSITPSASGGQPMQIYYMKKDNINLSHSSLTILVTIAIYQISMVCYALFAFLMNISLVIEKIKSIYGFIIFGFAINIILVSSILVAIFSEKVVFEIVKRVIALLYKVKIIKDIQKTQENIEKQIVEYKQGAKLIRKNIKVIIKIFIITFFQLTAMYSVPFFVYKAFGLNGFSFWQVIGLQSILNIAVSSLPLPGSVGAAEGTFIVLFKTFFPANMLTAAMLVSRGISYYILLIISYLVLIVIHFIPQKFKTV